MLKRDLLRIAVIVFGVSLCGIAAAAAGKYPTPTAEEIATCTADAFRLCIPKTGLHRVAIFSCMRANKHRLSEDCRAVFVRHGL